MSKSSKLLKSIAHFCFECMHCGAKNWVDDDMDYSDCSKMDIEGIKCWQCGKESLAGDESGDCEFYDDVDEAGRIEDGRRDMLEN